MKPPQMGGFLFPEQITGVGGGPIPQNANGERERIPPPLLGDPLIDGQASGLPDPKKERKFSNRARLFVGNLPRDFSQEELKAMFEKFGEVQEVFIQKEKNFGFVRMAFRSDAERAIASLNGEMIRGREVKVRFAASSCSVKVANINPLVSNELLEDAFSQFGEVESAMVVTDERGKSLGYGIVDFNRKSQAIAAIQRCKAGHYLLTKTAMPVLVTEMIRDNLDEGLPERTLPKNSVYFAERDCVPRFAEPGSLEHEIASRWAAFYDREKTLKDELEARLKEEKATVEKEIQQLVEQHQTLLLRQEIARHQQEQMRLAAALREQESRLHPGLHVGGPPPPLPPPMVQQSHPPPLFPGLMSPGTSGSLTLGSSPSNLHQQMRMQDDHPRGPPLIGSAPPGVVVQPTFIPPPLMAQKFQ